MKKILGLDLGTNSIGWSFIENDFDNKTGKILGIGSRIIPMSQNEIDDFSKGITKSATADRTEKRGKRRLYERSNLRRERLHRVLNILDFLPEHYKDEIDFEQNFGKFKQNREPKINYRQTETGKFEFIFKESYNEMLEDFRKHQPGLFYKKDNGEETKIPYDWTIYYLRKKALTQKISDQELAWILLNFNTKRGYYQQRDEEEYEKPNEKKIFIQEKVVKVEKREENKKGDGYWYDVFLENGYVYSRQSKEDLSSWQDTTKEFIVTYKLDEKGNIKHKKNGKEDKSLKLVDSEKDWPAIKAYTEKQINESNKFIGEFIYDSLLKNPNQKIRGKLIRTIDRKYYRNELNQILETQTKFNPKLQNIELFKKCINELYPLNENRRKVLYSIKDKNKFKFLFVDDILFYQRPLKSKKNEIANCKFEIRTYKDENGKKRDIAIKAIAKSNPYYQEFRIWQFIDNLKIIEREKQVENKLLSNVDVTTEFIKNENDKAKLFEFFNNKEKIKQKQFLNFFKLKETTHKWNFVEKDEYPLNETRHILTVKFKNNADYLKFYNENEYRIWHLFYSISSKNELEKALEKLYNQNKEKYNLPSNFVEVALKTKPFKKEYGTLSEKAIKKLLPLMRKDKYANIDDVCQNAKQTIDGIYERFESVIFFTRTFKNEEEKKAQLKALADDEITLGMLRSFADIPQKRYTNLQMYQASYAVYGKHSEAKDTTQWRRPQQIRDYLANEFKQHSLRNPIVEKVITETLRVVADIWEQFGNSEEDYFDEIHIEIGRDLKNTVEEKKRLTEIVSNNKNTNERIRKLLREFKKANIENVRPESLHQQDKLKIFESDILNRYTEKELKEQDVEGHKVDITKILRSDEPTENEILKYRLWLEQKYRSPYTGETIPLSKLFTSAYEIEHILPQARHIDNSFSNKVICETAVNKTKANQTGYEFIIKNQNKTINLGNGKTVKILSQSQYEEFVSQNFQKGSKKHKILLSEDIPKDFTEQQKANMRYISRETAKLLSRIVRQDGENELIVKNITLILGSVTNILKADWGLNQIWADLILPRFERLNKLTGTTDFTYYSEKLQKYLPNVPPILKKDFNPKRIDHRHHALDALIIACATKDHVNYINNKVSKSQSQRYDLRNKLCFKKFNDKNSSNYQWVFKQPWNSFVVDTKNKLQTTIVSFKNRQRILTKTTNKFISYKDDSGNLRLDKNGKPLKDIRKQLKGDMRAIRKQLHEETVQGKTNIRLSQKVKLADAISGFIEKKYIFKDKQLKKFIKQKISEGLNLKEIIELLKKNKYKFYDKDISNVDVYYYSNSNFIKERDHLVAVRKNLDTTFNSQKIESITDKGIQQILLNHLKQEKFNNKVDKKGKKINPEIFAFSPEGIEEMNKNIKALNNGKNHKPIYKVRIYTPLGNKFRLGEKGNKKDKYVITGLNPYFAIYANKDENGNETRKYDTISLKTAVKRLKEGKNPVPGKYFEKNKEYDLLFFLEPNDLVYVPTDEEFNNPKIFDFKKLKKEQYERIYKFTDGSGTTANFIPYYSAMTIFNMKKNLQKKNNISYNIQNEFGVGSQQSKNQNMIYEKTQIKSRCWKLKVNRLGEITAVER